MEVCLWRCSESSVSLIQMAWESPFGSEVVYSLDCSDYIPSLSPKILKVNLALNLPQILPVPSLPLNSRYVTWALNCVSLHHFIDS